METHAEAQPNGAPRTWGEKRQEVADAQRREYIAALVAAQKEIKSPHADGTNAGIPGRASKYATLEATRAAIVPIAAKHGLAIQQSATMTHARGMGAPDNEGLASVVVHTTVSHVGGFFETTHGVPIPAAGRTGLSAHSIASAVTYGRRYALSALFCLGTEDDDGNTVASSTWGKAEKATAKATAGAPLVSKWPREGDDVSYEPAAKGGAR